MQLRSFMPFCFGLFFYAAMIPSYADTVEPASSFSDPAKNIQVEKSNARFEITLASNKTTGYSWHLLNYDNQLITLVNHAYQAPQAVAIGKGGQEIWTFQVKDIGFTAPHISKITLLYAQPWNLKNNTKQLTFTVVTH